MTQGRSALVQAHGMDDRDKAGIIAYLCEARLDPELHEARVLGLERPFEPTQRLVAIAGRRGGPSARVGRARALETYRDELFGTEFLQFRYPSIQLARLDGEKYRKGGGPVGAALSALMDSPRGQGRAEIKADMLLEVIESGLDEARQILLVNLIETYLELTRDQMDAFRRVTSRKEYRKVQAIDETWMDRILRQGKEEGQKEEKKNVLLRQMHQKFGQLPDAVVAQVAAIEAADELDRLLSRILTAASLPDMNLPINKDEATSTRDPSSS